MLSLACQRRMLLMEMALEDRRRRLMLVETGEWKKMQQSCKF